MPLPELLLSNPPSLSEPLKLRSDELRCRIVRANYNTQFAQTAPELADFRRSIDGPVDGMNDNILSESFVKTVHFTTYDSYAPLLARFREKPCNARTVVNLLAPGLPDYIAKSSSTSGGLPKAFPKYNRWSKIRSFDQISPTISDPLRRRTHAWVFFLAYDQLGIEHDDKCPVTTVYLGPASAINRRMQMNLDPEKDEEKMGTFCVYKSANLRIMLSCYFFSVLDHAAPYAAGFIRKWSSFLFIHALFAVSNRSLEIMTTGHISTFVYMIRHLDTEFEMMVNCIADGTIPDVDGIAHVQHYLEASIGSQSTYYQRLTFD